MGHWGSFAGRSEHGNGEIGDHVGFFKESEEHELSDEGQWTGKVMEGSEFTAEILHSISISFPNGLF